jgi:putative FmdB family regulatory protein
VPIYEYACAACGAAFERLQKLSDPDPVECPSCGQPQVRRQVSAPAFRLAGSGWYETDFKKDGDTKRNLAAKDDASKSEAKSEAKPAGKSESKAEAGKADTPAPSSPAKPASDG